MVNLFFTLTIKVRSIHLQVMAISSECAQPLYKLGYETISLILLNYLIKDEAILRPHTPVG